MRTFLFSVLFTAVICTVAACAKTNTAPKGPAKTAMRAKIIEAFFSSPLKIKGSMNGFWSVDLKEFASHLKKSRKSDINLSMTNYYLRIEGSFCDELFFVDGGDFTMSAGSLKKLESTKDRNIYSVVYNRELPQGTKLTQGGILSAFIDERRIVVEFPDHKLTFFPSDENPAVLSARYGKTP